MSTTCISNDYIKKTIFFFLSTIAMSATFVTFKASLRNLAGTFIPQILVIRLCANETFKNYSFIWDNRLALGIRGRGW